MSSPTTRTLTLQGRVLVCLVHCCNPRTQKNARHSIEEGPSDRKELVQIHSGTNAQKRQPCIPCHPDLRGSPPTFTETTSTSFASVLGAILVQPINFPFCVNQGQFLFLPTKDSWFNQVADYLGSYDTTYCHKWTEIW